MPYILPDKIEPNQKYQMAAPLPNIVKKRAISQNYREKAEQGGDKNSLFRSIHEKTLEGRLGSK